MPTIRRFTITMLSVLFVSSFAFAQGPAQSTAVQSGLTITAAAAGERVRITAPSSVVQMHVEVYAPGGEKVFDQEIRGGNVFDWQLQDGQGQRLAPGTYVCVVTAKSVSGRLTQKIGSVSVEEKSVSLQAADSAQLSVQQTQAIGPVEENSSWTTPGKDGPQTPTVIANDGTDGQMIRGRGALTFRIGNFFSGIDKEQMRLTEGGNLGIGTSNPQATLDVAGTIRAQRFLVGRPGKTGSEDRMMSGDMPQAPDAVNTFQALIAGSGTLNRIAKWTPDGSTLGDSGITETAGGFVGIGTTAPGSKLVVSSNSATLPAASGIARFADADGVQTGVFADAFGTNPVFNVRRANGTAAAPSALQANQIIGVFGAAGYGTSAYVGTRARVAFLASEDWTNTANGTQITFSTNANGAATPGGTERMRIDNAGNVGIGITSPQGPLEVLAGGTQNQPDIQVTAYDPTNAGIGGRKARGTIAAPSAVQNNDTLLRLSAGGFGTSQFGGATGSVVFNATEDWTDTAQGTRISFFTTPNGSTAPAARMRIGNNGNVGIGTTTPNSKLDVAGTITATGFSGDGSGLTGVTATVADGSITSAHLASDLTLAGTTTGTFSGPLTGNASTADSATTAGNVTGVVDIANGGTGSATQNFVDLTTAQTVAGVKTFSDAPVISAISNTGTLTLPTTTDTLVGRATTDTLANKSLANASTFLIDGTDATKKIGFDTSGATTATTLTVAGVQTANRTITLPDADTTLVGTNTSQTLTNKTIDGNSNTLTNITATTVADGSITSVKLASSSITSVKLASDLTLAGTTTGTFSGPLTGNVTGNTSGSAASFTGSLVGDVTGTQGATVVSTVGAVTAANVATGANLANAATDANTASTIVKRDASGNFSAQTITSAGDVNLSTTNAAGTVGVINQNGARLIHSFGANNFFAGAGAGNFTMTGNRNTAIGSNALQSNTGADGNTAIGYFALNANTGGDNTASGREALANNQTGGSNVANGQRALYSNQTGGNNTATGTQALNDNTGSNNIGIGSSAGRNLTTGSNNIDIGNDGVAAESGIIRLGTSGTQTSAFVAGIRGTTTGVADAVAVVIDSNGQLGTISSSRRYKQDIKDMASTSSRLMALRPVTFRYLKPYDNGEKPMQFGLIAEEVAETFPELVVRNKEGQPETVKYQDLTPMLLNEVQKQAKTIAELQAQATNVSNGNTMTDQKGEATVTLPDNFVALNQDFRYQLTVVGQFAQAIVLEEVKGNQFKIKTDKPNVKVSWQVTSIRHDK